MSDNYTQEQYEKASNVTMLEYLQSNGYEIEQKGREYCLKEHDSLTFNGNKWFWHSQNIGGSTIQFLMKYEEMTLVDAVKKLSGDEISKETSKVTTKHNVEKKEVERQPFELPQKASDNKRVIAYLTQTRHIDFEVVNHAIKNGYVYQEEKFGNVVFAGRDKNGEYKYASKRSTSTNSKFRQDVTSSDKATGFVMQSERPSNTVYVFESPIEILSHQTLTKELTGQNFRNQTRISLGGVSINALKTYIENNPNIKNIVCCLNHDDAGQKGTQDIINMYATTHKIQINQHTHNDVNDMLVCYKENQKNVDEKIKQNSLPKRKTIPTTLYIDDVSPNIVINNVVHGNLYFDVNDKINIINTLIEPMNLNNTKPITLNILNDETQLLQLQQLKQLSKVNDEIQEVYLMSDNFSSKEIVDYVNNHENVKNINFYIEGKKYVEDKNYDIRDVEVKVNELFANLLYTSRQLEPKGIDISAIDNEKSITEQLKLAKSEKAVNSKENEHSKNKIESKGKGR